MKLSCIILAIVFCLILIEAHILDENDANSVLNVNDHIKHIKGKREKRMKNCKHYNHNCPDYTNAFQNTGVEDLMKDILFSVKDIAIQMKQNARNTFYPGYYDYRSEYNKCEDSRKELLTLYKELASHLKYSPPPPPPAQIIYVQYPVPATCNHTVNKTPSMVKTTEQTPLFEKKQIWTNTPKDVVTDFDGDGSRPVSFEPIQLNRPNVKPPPFDHGSTQEGLRNTNNNKPFYTNLDRFWNTKQRPRRYK